MVTHSLGGRVLKRITPADVRIPSGVLKELNVALEGLALPKEAERREEMLGSLAKIVNSKCGSRKIHQLRFPQSVVVMGNIRSLVEIAIDSHDSTSYLRFMAREDCGVGAAEFATVVRIFVNGREITFIDVPSEAKERGRAILKRMESLDETARDDSIANFQGSAMETGVAVYRNHIGLVDKYFSKGPVQCYVLSDPSVLRRWVGKGTTGVVNLDSREVFLSSTKQSLVQHELQHLFDMLHGINGESADREYRAKLAEILFADSLEELDRAKLNRGLGGYLQAELGVNPFELHHSGHTAAAARLVREFRQLMQDEDLPSYTEADYETQLSILLPYAKERARTIFDREYVTACGLTYDQILEPFRRNPDLITDLPEFDSGY